jgi:hypothetical protein
MNEWELLDPYAEPGDYDDIDDEDQEEVIT